MFSVSLHQIFDKNVSHNVKVWYVDRKVFTTNTTNGAVPVAIFEVIVLLVISRAAKSPFASLETILALLSPRVQVDFASTLSSLAVLPLYVEPLV